jgi:hypothetical protein
VVSNACSTVHAPLCSTHLSLQLLQVWPASSCNVGRCFCAHFIKTAWVSSSIIKRSPFALPSTWYTAECRAAFPAHCCCRRESGKRQALMSNVCLTIHAPLCNTHEMSSSCNFGHRPLAMWAAPSVPKRLLLHGHSSKESRDDFMPCHPRGAQLNAEQHWSPNPPYVQDAQLRPITLDQLLSSSCTQLVVAAKVNVAGTMLLVMSNVSLTLHAPLCNTHEMFNACNFGHRPVAMWAAPPAPT